MMEEYASEVADDIKPRGARAVAKETVKELKKRHPRWAWGARKGHYKDGWASKGGIRKCCIHRNSDI